jgi:hypothetical protein
VTTRLHDYTDSGFHVNVGAYVPLELKRDLQDLAHSRRRSVSEEIRVALQRHVSRTDREIVTAA